MPIKNKLDPAIIIISIVLLGSIFIFGAAEGTNKAMLNNKVMTFTNGSGFTATTLEIIDSSSGDISTKEYIQATTRLMIEGAVIDTSLKALSTGIGDGESAIKTHYNGIFTGSVVAFSYAPDPSTGWLLCDGSVLTTSPTDYSSLIAKLGTAWGATGQLPDLRGRYVFGTAVGVSGTDSWRINDGHTSVNDVGAHEHNVTSTSSGGINTSSDRIDAGSGSGSHIHNATGMVNMTSFGTLFRKDEASSQYRSSGSNLNADSSHTYGFGVATTATTRTDSTGSNLNNLSHTHFIPQDEVAIPAGSLGSTPAYSSETRPLNAAVYFCIYSGVGADVDP